MDNDLESFYGRWQEDRSGQIEFDNSCAIRKVETIVRNVPQLSGLKIRSAVDFGCGWGQALAHLVDRLGLESAHGFDFSRTAIDYASKRFGSTRVMYHRLETLDIDGAIEQMKGLIGGKVDCVVLLDLLEHVADCKQLIARLSEIATYFVIKLPVESNLLDNYLSRNKVYPSPQHYNGHLREFNANSVFYFIREVGLSPMAEGLYLYHPKDLSGPERGLPLPARIKLALSAALRKCLSLFLHKKLFIAVCGPGGYYCVATYNRNNVLNP